MRLNLQHLNIRSMPALDSWVENHIFALARARQIDEANIRLVRLENASPAYHVYVHLVTPGPDIFANGRDHTLRAAFTKALDQLRAGITRRAARRLQNLKNHLKPRRNG